MRSFCPPKRGANTLHDQRHYEYADELHRELPDGRRDGLHVRSAVGDTEHGHAEQIANKPAQHREAGQRDYVVQIHAS